MTTKTKTEATVEETAAKTVGSRLNTVRETTTDVAGAFTTAGKLYVSGVQEIGKTLFGFGREIFDETVQHSRATMQAKNLRTVAELQAAFAQNRIETSAAHVKEFADVTRVKTEETIKPIIDLLDKQKAA